MGDEREYDHSIRKSHKIKFVSREYHEQVVKELEKERDRLKDKLKALADMTEAYFNGEDRDKDYLYIAYCVALEAAREEVEE
jgi:uncharacterized membrane protein YkvA (DUF1232 family)